jgi:mannose-6-phosphate isomerase
MRNQIRDYGWGSTSALALMQSRTPSGGPEAELWMGSHPSAPSELQLESGRGLPLDRAIADSPDTLLGPAVVHQFGARLPYMLKVLAIARPLSVQVHPDAARARAAYRPGGSSPYVDPYHKPEMLYALEPIEALYGFRAPAQAAMLIARLGSERLSGLVDALAGPAVEGAGGSVFSDRRAPADQEVPVEDEAARLHAALAELINWPLEDRASLVAEIAAGSSRLTAAGSTDYPEAFGWLDRLIGLHPADPMVLAPLLLDVIKLSPGQTVYVAAGVPHCYLSGFGVEILAASDNVVRAGLTGKAIDVEELLRVIDCRPLVSPPMTVTGLSEHEIVWRPDVTDFQLSRIVVEGVDAARPLPADPTITGPQILLCTRGKVQVKVDGRTVQLLGGSSAFVAATAGQISLSGDGEVFRAAPGQF